MTIKNKTNKLEHIYIHWPFCKNKCHYCDFVSFQNHEGFEEQYHNALRNEINQFSKNNPIKNKIKTIFLGGGTPSLYPLNLLKNLFVTLNNNFDLSTIKEITIETNPEDITQNKLQTWKQVGINRLSMGVQILDNNILQKLNRTQTEKHVNDALNIIPQYFDNISIDLILGLPGTTLKKWEYTLNKVLNWPITHISVYLLTVYEKTPLFFKINQKQVSLLKENLLIKLYENTVSTLEKNGLKQYEISNFAQQGFESTHNKAYWDRKPYKGFGLNSSSFDGICRYKNQPNLLKYLSQKNKSQPFFKEKLDRSEEILETLMLCLRQKKGLNLQRMVYSLKNSKKQKLLDEIKSLESEQLIQKTGENIHLTLKGMMLENEVILRLI